MNWRIPELSDGWVSLVVITGGVLVEICIIQWPRIAEYMGWAQ